MKFHASIKAAKLYILFTFQRPRTKQALQPHPWPLQLPLPLPSWKPSRTSSPSAAPGGPGPCRTWQKWCWSPHQIGLPPSG